VSLLSGICSLVWCIGTSWFFAGDSAAHYLLGIAMVAAVGAGTFVYVTVTAIVCLALAISGSLEVWRRVLIPSESLDGSAASHAVWTAEQAQSYTIAFLVVAASCAYALADARRQQRERFRRQYMQERLRAEREAQRRARTKAA